MAYTATIVGVFLSSPSDVGDDRQKIQSAMSAWNQRNGRQRSLFFNPLTWEDLVAPDVGDTPQEVINRQIGDEYDIFLGIMWSRFGTPTGEAESGTEEEFRRALERHGAGGEITISFLFKTSPIPTSILDGVQYSKVQEFKKTAAEAGCLYREYSDEASLINAINLVLDRFCNSLSKEKIDNKFLSKELASVQIFENPRADDSEELGLFEINDLMEKEGGVFGNLMAEWSERMGATADAVAQAAEKINIMSRFGSPNQNEVRSVIEGMAKDTLGFVEWGETVVSDIEDSIDRFSLSFSLLMDVSQDFTSSDEEIENSISVARTLCNTIDSANISLNGLAATSLGFPRISKSLNKANKRLADLLGRMVLKNETFKTNIEIGINELEKRRGGGAPLLN